MSLITFVLLHCSTNSHKNNLQIHLFSWGTFSQKLPPYSCFSFLTNIALANSTIRIFYSLKFWDFCRHISIESIMAILILNTLNMKLLRYAFYLVMNISAFLENSLHLMIYYCHTWLDLQLWMNVYKVRHKSVKITERK